MGKEWGEKLANIYVLKHLPLNLFFPSTSKVTPVTKYLTILNRKYVFMTNYKQILSFFKTRYFLGAYGCV